MSNAIPTLEAALQKCQAANLRVSRQRHYILELLCQTGEHLTARDIYDRLNQQGKPIGHTSVYQNLEALSSHNVVECIDRGDGRLYGRRTDPHNHVNCLDSGRILDVDVELPTEVIAAVEAQTGTRIQGYRIEFFGCEYA
ncbi:MAG: Fur family transcriptional regulator [Synechococcales cyanobacterium]